MSARRVHERGSSLREYPLRHHSDGAASDFWHHRKGGHTSSRVIAHAAARRLCGDGRYALHQLVASRARLAITQASAHHRRGDRRSGQKLQALYKARERMRRAM